ncbi:MAG: deoxyribodipyrimidine photo-lyase [Phycisphaerae bacterium]
MINAKRIMIVKQSERISGPIVYWMSRDQRTQDNWALLHSQSLALERNASLAVVFCLVPAFLNASFRSYSFMIKGLGEVERKLAKKGIPFFLITGLPEKVLPLWIRRIRASLLVTDFDPLRIKREWQKSVADQIDIPLHVIDAHNIVPSWTASSKQEYAAYTIRPKIHRALPEFLEDFPRLKKHPFPWPEKVSAVPWEESVKWLKVDRKVEEVAWLTPGEKAAHRKLKFFLENKLSAYDQERNYPVKDGQSNLSPYLHFGQISAQRVAWEVVRSAVPVAAKETFLEELIVRRELADNFCFYNPDYDRFDGFPTWAQATLNAHRRDRRPYLYSLEQLEQARTHDDLWNAAQIQMMRTGKMHGFMRMYWAKKIMEWTALPHEALRIAIYLNDKYELDGRDPNGYTGIAWSIGGVHDRAWPERSIFGKIRYMSYNGCKSKFDIKFYITQ